MYPTDFSAPGDLQDMSTPSPVKVWTLTVSYHCLTDMGVTFSYRLSLFLQATLVDPCSCKKESATFRSAILLLKKASVQTAMSESHGHFSPVLSPRWGY